MIPYITNRGGPLLGLEALSMQGLPIDELLLTRESEDNLRDLAGNAMTSTVVGASIIAALCVGVELLQPGVDKIEEVMDIDDSGIASHDLINGSGDCRPNSGRRSIVDIVPRSRQNRSHSYAKSSCRRNSFRASLRMRRTRRI